MALLYSKQALRQRAADSLTLPDFDALTSLDPGNGDYLSLEARINDTSLPVSMELQRDVHTNRLDYELHWGGVEFYGTVDVVEHQGEFEAQVTLDRFNGKRVYEESDGKDGTRIMYRQGPRHERQGIPREIPVQALKQAAYWVPTIINHIAKNVDYFLRELKGEVQALEVCPVPVGLVNQYRLENVPEQEAAVREQFPEHHSPSAHYRSSHERTVATGLESLTVSVTGTYVNTDWKDYSTPEVLFSLHQHARDILPRHFKENILPQIAAAGHSYVAVRETYERARGMLEELREKRVA